jgi:hypothetical protein
MFIHKSLNLTNLLPYPSNYFFSVKKYFIKGEVEILAVFKFSGICTAEINTKIAAQHLLFFDVTFL